MEVFGKVAGLFWLVCFLQEIISPGADEVPSLPVSRREQKRRDRLAKYGRIRCERDQFAKLTEDGVAVCEPCTICPPGKGVAKRCGRYKDTVCRKCTAGHFSNIFSRHDACQSCSSCENARVKKRCKAKRDTVCGNCNIGYFFDSLYKTCERCGYCFPDHPELRTQKLQECSRGGYPDEFQCIPLQNAPYDQPPYPEVSPNRNKNKPRRRKNRNRD